jgi:predicted phosphoribosyltransferase
MSIFSYGQPFHDRFQAGAELARDLPRYRRRRDALVLGLPRGGVPVAAALARELALPLDVFLVRKFGVPGQPELAMGAVASGGVRVLNPEIVEAAGLSDDAVDEIARRERDELERRERVYRDGRPPPDLNGKTVIMADDGLATGATMVAALRSVRRFAPGRVVAAVPVASPHVCEEMHAHADEVVCARTPEHLYAIGAWYENFGQVTDDEVKSLLNDAGDVAPGAGGR